MSIKGMKLTKLSAAPLRGRSAASCPRWSASDAGTASQLIPGVRPTIGGNEDHRMPRFRLTTLMLVLGCVGLAAGQPPGGEKADAGCTARGFRYAQLCTQPLESQGRPPQLLDDARRRQPCRDVSAGEDPLAKLEVLVDQQGRLVRAKVLDPRGPCATKCLKHTFGLPFLPASVAGIPTMQTTTVVCWPAPAEEGASGRTTRCS
jgi:hypothetical protein